MGWQESRQRHKESETLTELKVEDMVARRVLRGLGYVERRLPELERVLGLQYQPDATTWERTREVLFGLCARTGLGWAFTSSNHMFDIEIREVDAHHKDIKDMEPVWGSLKKPPYPLILTKVKGTQTSLAYFAADSLSPAFLCEHVKPPFSVVADFDDWWIVMQETEHFFAQFGPYSLGPEN